jgi:high-affinity iron transporter
MEAFVITLREGVEAALIIGLILAYLNRTSRRDLRGWVFAGLGLALAASVVAAFGFSLLGFDPENELYEGVLYAVAAVMVVSLVVWMWRNSRGMKQQVEGRLEKLTSTESRGYAWGLLAFVFFMVFREGVETVLFLAALSLTQTPNLVGMTGGILGLLMAVLVGVLFIKGSLRINLRLFFAITGFVLLLLALRLAAGSVHEFYEVGLLPLPHRLEEAVELLTGNGASTAILVALLALPAVAFLPKRWLGPVISRASR